MSWHDLLPVAVFLVTFIASVMSGMAGGGGGFILTPFYILIGLSPQQTVATLKFASFGLSAGAISAFRERMLERKRFSIFIMVLATCIGLISSLLIRNINNESLQLAMGIFMLAMVPFIIRKNSGSIKPANPTLLTQIIGTISLAFILLLQGVIGSGIGSLVSVIFILFFGASMLEANMLKRKASLLLNIIVVAGLLGSGLINFTYGFFGMAGGLVGGFVGSRIAINKGEDFAKYALLVFMVVSGIWLIATA